MNSPYRPSFGWLLLGLAWGVLVGHAIAAHLLIPPDYFEDRLRLWACALLGGGMVGIGGGAVVDAFVKRGTTWLDWAALAAAVIVALLFFPQLNVARE